MRRRQRPASPTSLERELALLERRLMAELRRELDRQLLEHKRYVDGELGRINERIDGALARSLRALNLRQGGTPA